MFMCLFSSLLSAWGQAGRKAQVGGALFQAPRVDAQRTARLRRALASWALAWADHGFPRNLRGLRRLANPLQILYKPYINPTSPL